MINPFPTLLDFNLLAPTLLRVVLGIYFIYLGYIKISKKKEEIQESIPLWQSGDSDPLSPTKTRPFSHRHTDDLFMLFDTLSMGPASYYVKTLAIAEIIVGAFLCIGFFTQVSAIVTATISFASFLLAYKHRGLNILKPSEYILLTVISISLLFLGAGILAIDLPL